MQQSPKKELTEEERRRIEENKKPLPYFALASATMRLEREKMQAFAAPAHKVAEERASGSTERAQESPEYRDERGPISSQVRHSSMWAGHQRRVPQVPGPVVNQPPFLLRAGQNDPVNVLLPFGPNNLLEGLAAIGIIFFIFLVGYALFKTYTSHSKEK